MLTHSMDEPRVPNPTTSSPHSTPPSLTAIQEIELQIVRESTIAPNTQAIINLKIERNSHLPVSQLPVEILCGIFKEAQQSCVDERIYRSRGPGLPNGLSWIVATHVCHYWRNAALNEPSLWTRPILKHEQWTSVILERSRMAGLTLAFNHRQSNMRPELMVAVISHLPHTTTLTINDMQREAMERLFKHLTLISAPMLTTLAINGWTAVTHSSSLTPLPSNHRACFVLPEGALLGTKTLRRVSLYSISIALTSSLFTRLTDLTLDDINYTGKPTPTEFLSMLQRNLTLRNLTIRSALPSAGSLTDSSYTGPRIPLPYLETIDISSDAPSCEFLYRNIALSDQTKKITTALKYELNTDRLFYKLLSALNEGNTWESLGSSSRHVIINGEIPAKAKASHQKWNMTFLAGKTVSTAPYNSNTADFEFYLRFSPKNQSEADISSAVVFVDFFEAFHWENLSQLDLCLYRVDDPEFAIILARTVGTLPELRTVNVQQQACTKPLIDALLLNSDMDPTSYPLSVTFRGLQHISFSGIIFSETSTSFTRSRGLVSFDRLVDCLKDRHKRGVKIQSLEISFPLSRNNHERLAKVVSIVNAVVIG